MHELQDIILYIYTYNNIIDQLKFRSPEKVTMKGHKLNAPLVESHWLVIYQTVKLYKRPKLNQSYDDSDIWNFNYT